MNACKYMYASVNILMLFNTGSRAWRGLRVQQHHGVKTNQGVYS